MKPALGVVILGAGASSRMGRPKLLLRWGKTTVIGHLIGGWQALRARQIAVVCRPGDGPLSAELRRLEFPDSHCIVNPAPERGMFSSIIAAAKWNGWVPGLTAWVISLGDQPHLRPATLRGLMAFHARHPEAICQPVFDGHARHPVVLPRDVFFKLRQSRSPTLKAFIGEAGAPFTGCPIDDAGLSLDLDYPEDYVRLSPSLPHSDQ